MTTTLMSPGRRAKSERKGTVVASVVSGLGGPTQILKRSNRGARSGVRHTRRRLKPDERG